MPSRAAARNMAAIILANGGSLAKGNAMTVAEKIAAKLHPRRWERVQTIRAKPFLYSVSMVEYAESAWGGVIGEIEHILDLAEQIKGQP